MLSRPNDVKLPEPLFVVVNPIVSFLLKSPLHIFCSKSLMLITFTGRKSQRKFTTPVRYVSEAGVVRCFTSRENQWWRNIRGGASVKLRIEGRNRAYHADAIENNPTEVTQWLLFYLAKFPQDASYHNIRLNQDKSLNSEDLERASRARSKA